MVSMRNISNQNISTCINKLPASIKLIQTNSASHRRNSLYHARLLVGIKKSVNNTHSPFIRKCFHHSPLSNSIHGRG
jgi:hypothetical protein